MGLYSPNKVLSQSGGNIVEQKPVYTSDGAADAYAIPALDPSGKIDNSFLYNGAGVVGYDYSKVWAAGDECVLGCTIIRANAAIPANTGFAWGTTGATWSPVVGKVSTGVFNWRGVYASATVYAVGDVFATSAGGWLYRVISGFTSVGTADADLHTAGSTLINSVYLLTAGVTPMIQGAAPKMIGSTSTAAGRQGATPAPAAGDQAKFLRGDGLWANPGAAPAYVESANYTAGDQCMVGGAMVRANGAIPANTVFVWGTTGATWSMVLPTSTAAPFNWRGTYAATTAYAIGDVFSQSSAINSPLVRVNTAFTSGASGNYVTDSSSGGVAALTTDPLSIGIPRNNNAVSFLIGATPTMGGRAGLAPAPAAGSQGKMLMGDAVWRDPPLTLKNKIIDGRFDFWYESSSQTSSGYGSDTMWINAHVGDTKTHSAVSLTQGVDLPCVDNPSAGLFSRTVVTSIAGSENYVTKYTCIENVATLSGKKATLSFYAKADSVKTLGLHFSQNFGTGGSTQVYFGGQLFNLTTTWQRFTATVDVPSISGKTIGAGSLLRIMFWFDGGSSVLAAFSVPAFARQSGTFDIACVQLEEGSVATKFEELPIAIARNNVDRYFEQLVIGRPNCTIYCANGDIRGLFGVFRTVKRSTPTVTPSISSFSGILFGNVSSTLNLAATITSIRADTHGWQVLLVSFASGYTAMVNAYGQVITFGISDVFSINADSRFS